jgi:eukaryotic-like serine/threonine-protein kinase
LENGNTDPRIGSILDGRYRILRKLAEGSMSIVYRGQRLQLRRPVAIKFLHSSLAGDKEFLTRFEIEAQTMSQLSHPNCISVNDFGVTDAPYIVMDLVRGQTLQEIVSYGPMEPRRAIHIISQVLAALAHAHKRGIIHRDVKPSNIMLTEVTYTGDHVCLFDFGLAKLAEAGPITANDDDMVAGTVEYMSPEHLNGRELDWRADLFSIAVVLYQLLTGSKPFHAISPEQILEMHDVKPALLSDAHMGETFSRELQDTMNKALELNPEKRFQSAVEFGRALNSVPEGIGPAISTVPPSPDMVGGAYGDSWMPQGGSVSKSVYKWVAFVLVLVVLVGAGTWFVIDLVGNKDGSNDVLATGLSKVDRVEPAPAPKAEPEPKPELVPEPVPEPVPAPELEAEVESEPEPSPMLEPESESETAPTKASSSNPVNLAKVTVLIRAGRTDLAIRRLTAIETEYPDNAYVRVLLGNLLAEKKHWLKAIERYREAIRLDKGYASHRILISNMVRSIGFDDAYEQARAIIERDIGPDALPELRRLTKQAYSKKFRRRAAELIEKLDSDKLK